MRELNVNEIEVVAGGFKKSDKGSNHKKTKEKRSDSLGGFVDGFINELSDLADAINGLIDGFNGTREDDPDSSTK
jgi:hypothetical protein